MPTDRAHRLPQQAQPRTIRPHRPQPSTSDAATQLRHARPAPNERRYTRYVAMHPIRRGVMPTDRVHHLPQQAQPRTLPPHRPQPAASDAATRPRHAHPGSEREALHPLRRAAPDPSRCTRYVALHPLRRDAPEQKGCNANGSGAPPPTTSTTADISSRHTQATASDAATQPRNTRPAPYKRRYTRYVALHPLRRATPVTSQCTRYVAIHPIRRGAMPTDRVHRLPQQAQPRAIRPHRPQPSTSDAVTQLRHVRPAPNERRYTRYVALHPLRRATPVTSRYTRSEGVQCLRIGCTTT